MAKEKSKKPSSRAKPNSDHKELYAELLTRQSDLTRHLHAADYL